MDSSTLSRWWTDAESAHNDFVQRAKIATDFVLPDKQWNRDDIQILDSQNEPHLTINKVFPIVYFLSGYQRQNKFDIIATAKKVDRVSDIEAKIISQCIKGITDDDDAQYEISDWFLTGIIKGLSWLGGYVDYQDDPINGDLKLESLNPYDIYPDPNARKYGLQDASFLFKKLWKSVAELRELFPGKVPDINATSIDNADDIIYGEGDEYRDINDRTLVLRHTEKVRVKECWYLTDKTVAYLIDQKTGEIIELDSGADEKIRNIKAIKPELAVVKRPKKVLHLSTSIGNTILQDIENPIGKINRIPFVPFYAYKIDNNVFGVVDQLIDVQKEVNKRRSQALHIVNTMTNNLWLLHESAGLNEGEFLRKVSKVGGAVTWKGNVPPQNVGPTGAQGAQVATYASEQAESDIKEISGVNADLMGYSADRKEPGIVLQLRQAQGAVVIESIMDNFRYSNRILGSLLIDFIQKSGLYSPNEIVKITDEQGQEVDMGVASILGDNTLKKYKVAVSFQKSAPTLRTADFMKLMSLVEKGVPIPPDVLIEASDIPYKDKILQRLHAAQAEQAAQPAAGVPGKPIIIPGR